ncbi:GH39 family glycosyl hydrolase [Wenyingzhuangia sp. IMCC45574]
MFTKIIFNQYIVFVLICTSTAVGQVQLSTDFSDDGYQKSSMHNIWSVANRISPKYGSNVREGLKINTIRMIGGIRKKVNGKFVKDLDFDTCLYDSVNNTYVYKFERLIRRLNKIVNSQTEIHQIVLDQPCWAFQHGYTFIPKGTIDSIHFRENEEMSIYGNSLPPADKKAYHDYIKALITKLVDTYGEQKVTSWRFRVGSEIETPDHWFGTKQDFIEHFVNTVNAIRAVLPDAKIGLHTRAPDFLYKKGTVLNYKGEPYASFADGLIRYCYDNNIRYDFWGVSDYVILKNAGLRNMRTKYDKLFGALVNHPKWNKSATVDIMEYATITMMHPLGNAYITAETTHTEIIELSFSNIFYKNKEQGFGFIYRWGNRKRSIDSPGITTLNSMNKKVLYTTDIAGKPKTRNNCLDAFFAKDEKKSAYDVLVYNYNSKSLAYVEKEPVEIVLTTELPVKTKIYYRSIAYNKSHNKLQNFLENEPASGWVKKGFDAKGSPSKILNKEGLKAYKNYENPNTFKYTKWKKIKTTPRTDGSAGSVIRINTDIPSFAFEKFEFRTKKRNN